MITSVGTMVCFISGFVLGVNFAAFVKLHE